MKSTILRVLILLCLIGGAVNVVQAAIIDISLQGNGGKGLQIGSENPPVANGGSGGELGSGILFDNVSLQLTVNIGWGSGNGFSDLTGTATAGHIHGPTTLPAPGSFNQNASPLFDFSGAPWNFNTSATNGSVTGMITLTAAQAQALNEGRLYINIHTSTNPTGEIRGYLIVPEPATYALLALGSLSLLPVLRRVRK